MKKLFYSVILVICLTVISTADVLAQDNVIKLNPLSLLMRTANVSYEKIVGDKTSFQIGAFYSNLKYSGDGFSGFGITPEFRYYTREAGSGFYLAPYTRYWNLGATIKDEAADASVKGSISLLSLGANLGTQINVGSNFKIDLFIGPQYFSMLKASAEASVGDFEESAKSTGFLGGGFWLRTGINIGYTF